MDDSPTARDRPARLTSRVVATSAAVPWLLRAAWVGVAVGGGSAVGQALADRSRDAQVVLTAVAWAAWTIGALAMAVPAERTLTAARAVVPGSLAAGVVVLAAGGAGPVAAVALVALAVLSTALVLSGELGRAFVQAAAYGDERRFPLRAPLGFAVLAVVTWLVWCASVVAAAMLLAAGSWILGAVSAVVAVAATWLFLPRWHRLTRRWLVFVPAGLVIHDHVVLADTVLLRRVDVRSIGLARAGTEAADLTGPATGHAVEITTIKPITVVLAPTPAHPTGRAIHATAALVAPSRPGQVLAEADRRRFALL